jgi:hypothetical protein
LLGDLASADVEASKQDFAERLGLWLDVFDGMTLHAAHQSIKPLDDGKPSDALLAGASALEEEFHRVRTDLVKAITASAASPGSEQRVSRPRPAPEAATQTDGGYAPYRQRYLDQQRHLALRIDGLRAHVRQAIAKVSPALGQLASFDAVMAQMLGGREQKLLSTVPQLLERRFEHLRKTGPPGLAVDQQQDSAASRPQAGRWQDRFGREWQEVLLAELEVRLQPVVGLMEALRNEVKRQP